jgi:hypothetical protein
MRATKLLLTLTILICTCLISEAASAKAHDQVVSQDTAGALCKGHGGGTDCSFCHGGHCHIVTCGLRQDGKCTNHVISNLRGKPTGVRAPVKGVKATDTGGSHPRPHRPVKVESGLKPVVSSNHNGGTSTGQTGRRH